MRRPPRSLPDLVRIRPPPSLLSRTAGEASALSLAVGSAGSSSGDFSIANVMTRCVRLATCETRWDLSDLASF
eukprot:SAG11_NODE_581_length_8363_cov_13.931873_8_plen_73_part_00